MKRGELRVGEGKGHLNPKGGSIYTSRQTPVIPRDTKTCIDYTQTDRYAIQAPRSIGG